MQKFLLLGILSFFACKAGDTVYLCNGPQSKVYHKTTHCQGLRRCSTDIEATDISKAKAKHRRECGYCY